MDFFERQRTVRTSSTRLVLLFVLAVVLIVAAIDGAVLFALTRMESPSTERLVTIGSVVALAVVGMIGAVSMFRIVSLRAGGGAGVARKLGAVPLEELASTPELVRYRNVVEEVAIASATPVPQLFVLTREPGINAFAAGSTPADAAVAVTHGTLERLNRDELQAVIGHEFSHIVNGDMRLSMRLIGVLAGITVLGVIGRILLYSGGGRRKEGAVLLVAGLVTMLVGFIGVFFARLIKAAISRQREYLADASAVQYTRQTEGLAGALKKIGGLEEGSKLRNGRVEDVSHMLFGEGMNFSSMFATHPPLVERIRELEPGFDPDELGRLEQQWRRTPPNGLREDAAHGLAGPGEAVAPARASRPPQPDAGTPRGSGAVVGEPSAESYEASAELIAAIPEPLMSAAHRSDLVVGLIHGLLLSPVPEVRQAQYDVVAAGHGPEVADQAWQAGAAVDELDAAARIPLAELAFPALRQRSKDDIRTVIAVVSDLVRADRQVSVFEYCLGTLLWTQLSEALTGRPPWGTRRHRLDGVRGSAATLLAAVAWAGHGDESERVAAFRAGADVLYPGTDLPYAPPGELPDLDAVWGDLDGLEGEEKARLVEAIVATVHADRTVRTSERELVRTVCGVLHCPIPPQFRVA